MASYNIYPKQFRNSRIPIEKNRCFMLMPFSSKYDLIYGEIKRHLLNADLVCNRADEIFGSVPIMSNVLKEILRAHFVIADLTEQNANVFYELGIAHSFKDAHNIILISQNLDDVPFDIRHLSTIIYREENIKHLTSSIYKTIKDNSHFFSFFEALQKYSIINLIHDDKEEFLETIQEFLGTNLPIATGILEGFIDPYSETDIKLVLDSCLGILYSTSVGNSRKHLRGTMAVIAALLCNCEEFKYAHEVMKHLLYEIKLEHYPIGREEIIFLQSDLAVTLATNKVFFTDAISWIIDYFSKSKSGTVDLNRYNLEKFLLTTNDLEVDTAIVNSMLHNNYYVREHMADIIGEKKILSGLTALLMQLGREENIYATSSIITALGKLGDKKAFAEIEKWVQKNEDRIVRTQHFFILKHIHLAFVKMGVSNDFTDNFQTRYAEHLTPLAIY